MSKKGFDVSLGRHLMTGLVHHTRWLWRWVGELETKVLREELEGREVETPVYISGLARSGSTILLRVISAHPQIVTHQYQDFPFLYMPYWWQETLDRQAHKQLEPAERAHKDRLKVTPESPEAMEEVLWMSFFDELHDPSVSNILDGTTDNPKFESFYRDHIRKLLLARGGSRYAAKGNYNVTRFEYLLELFPDAKFVVPIRHPRSHIASSRKQHRLFCEEGADDARAISHLKRVGHFEFGPHRRPINAGDDSAIRAIQECWSDGHEVRGWAKYWAHLYGYLGERLSKNEKLRDATILVRYEDLCDDTDAEVRRVLEHCELDDCADHIATRFKDQISRPDYYEQRFDAEEREIIAEETAGVAQKYDYELSVPV